MLFRPSLPLVFSTVHCSQLALPAVPPAYCPPQVNSVNCNTSWKINLFMQFRDHLEEVLKGVSPEPLLCPRQASVYTLELRRG